MNDYRNLIAHYDKDNSIKEQLLTDHLLEVSRITGVAGRKLDLKSICELIGLLHDFGKSSNLFQLYIRGEYKGRVNHSSAGAKILDYIQESVKKNHDINELLKSKRIKISIWNLYKEILQYPILAHHGLYDIINKDLDYHTEIRLDYDKDGEYDFRGEGLNFFNFLDKEYELQNGKTIDTLYYEGFIEFIEIYAKLKEMASMLGDSDNEGGDAYRRKALHFYYGALVRLLLSILKEGDIYDSSNYYREHKDKIYSEDELDTIWTQMGDDVEQLYNNFRNNPDKSELDAIRTDLANQIYTFSQENNTGTYKLSMPVGSGKTYAALRYSAANAKKYKKSRLFYTTAFLSVLEQNASSIKEVIGGEYVLEHHSNIIEDFEDDCEDDDQREYEVNEYLKESWECPVILTTIVQLSNTMFKDKSSNIRRFSKLINSVIIIDEVQSLPTKVIYNFNLMTNFLANIMRCNIVHCTATHPNFERKDALKYPCFYGGQSKKISVVKEVPNSRIFHRVDYYNLLGENLNTALDTEEILAHLKEQLEAEVSALIVLNTKRAVSNLYNGLLNDEEIQDSGYDVVYLTTNQCPKHRLDIIENMKKRLKEIRQGGNQRKLICVSTKLVEAGVDIDFDLVYRSIAGIDSIIQCGGRCNREGEKITKGRLFIFEYGDESLKYLSDIRKQREAAKTALRFLQKDGIKGTRINIEKACDHYFAKLYLNESAEGRYLEFLIDKENDTILDLLTTNPNGVANYKNNKGKKPLFVLKQGFKTAAANFDLIKENTVNVIVRYDNEELMDKLYDLIDKKKYHEIKMILKKLQPYSIAIRRSGEYENSVSKELDGRIFILNKEAYDKNIGLVKGELELLMF